MNLVKKRLENELKFLQNNPVENCSAGLIDDNNLFEWNATIFGPVDTPYENGIFKLIITFPENFPYKPPKVKFITPIYHCNFNKHGDICLDILKDKWSPALNIKNLLLSICSLLSQPNPNDPLDHEIADIYKENKAEHDKYAQAYTFVHTNKL